MEFSESEKSDWAERVQLHLLDGIDIYEEQGGWKWDWHQEWERSGDVHPDWPASEGIFYKTRDACLNAVLFVMQNSPKLGYAKNIAAEGVKHVRASK